MKGFVQNIESLAVENVNFRKVIYTAKNSQLVLMSLKPQEDIGAEIHKVNHNIINTGTVPMKLYTLYAPPNHRDGVIHKSRSDAEGDTEHFNGKTTE